MQDNKGTEFPWPTPTLSEMLSGKAEKQGDEIDLGAALDEKFKVLYFSAHWVSLRLHIS